MRRTAPQIGTQTVRWLAPGVRYTRWFQTDTRGKVRVNVLTVKLGTPGVRLDYASPGPVAKTATVRDILKVDKAVAGINGDFFDIGRTGAPLGLGRDRERGLLHGRALQQSAGFYLDAQGQPHIQDLMLKVGVQGHPEITIGAVNSPYVLANGVGLYSPRWGRKSSYFMTAGQRSPVRTVWIHHGRVTKVTSSLPKGHTLKGQLLVGRGGGAQQLAALRPGTPVDFVPYFAQKPRVLITGNRLLVVNGAVQVTDDRVMHPRTAIGIDEDTGNVLMVVVDGRQKLSRGYTMVEMANLMIQLGAEQALNLDGGGSSTMIGRRESGKTGVVNHPSDGVERRVANGLEVTYRKPRR